MNSATLSVPHRFKAFQKVLYAVGVEMAETSGEARLDASPDGGGGSGTLLGELDP